MRQVLSRSSCKILFLNSARQEPVPLLYSIVCAAISVHDINSLILKKPYPENQRPTWTLPQYCPFKNVLKSACMHTHTHTHCVVGASIALITSGLSRNRGGWPLQGGQCNRAPLPPSPLYFRTWMGWGKWMKINKSCQQIRCGTHELYETRMLLLYTWPVPTLIQSVVE